MSQSLYDPVDKSIQEAIKEYLISQGYLQTLKQLEVLST
jgi:hypothetical protein